MTSPNKVLWPCVIEKAYAVRLGSYIELNGDQQFANEFWKVLVGSAPLGFDITHDTDNSKILEVAKAAGKVPCSCSVEGLRYHQDVGS